MGKIEEIDNSIFGDVAKELQRQIDKWGIQHHDPLVWNAILGEEVGEVSKAILETWFQDRPGDGGEEYRKELIQVAAVAISAIRALDIQRSIKAEIS